MNNPMNNQDQGIQLIQESRLTGVLLVIGGLVLPGVLMFVFYLAGAYALEDGVLVGIAYLVPLFLAVGLIVFGVNTMVQPVNSVTYIMQTRAYNDMKRDQQPPALPAPEQPTTNYMHPVKRVEDDVMTRTMRIAGEVRGQWVYELQGRTVRGDVIEAFVEHYTDEDRPTTGSYRDYVRRVANIQASQDQFSLAAAALFQWGVLDKSGAMVLGKRAALDVVAQKRRQLLT